ncbi:hypothetical protein [Micropruina sonneratiae]|uniref:hypothetical protein n=1 Tax=Micropruina sonneratiae TaxID=2986940 RepID=UPI002226B592|nr:hypothetical protein [Micropruina sp. KQZ13P-5]MCW3159121.1 hypothetical protein [Micropruina sp. KQZ13P-5]
MKTTKYVKNASSGKHATIFYQSKDDERAQTQGGYCKKLGGGAGAAADGGEQVDTVNGTTYCRVDSIIQGISNEEMNDGYLTIEGNRWVRCPPGINIEDAVSATLDLDAIARSLAVQLHLPDATPIFSPDPKNNEWKMLTVGFPVWLRTDGPDSKSTTASAQGLTFRLSATRTSTNFTMGDGKTLTCTAMARYSETVKAGSPSPNCGHTYQQPSGKGRYTVTGTHHWTIAWSVDGFSGSFPMTYSDSATIRIGELSSLNR